MVTGSQRVGADTRVVGAYRIVLGRALFRASGAGSALARERVESRCFGTCALLLGAQEERHLSATSAW